MLLLGAWLHDLSPFALRFTDDFGLRWYGLSYAAGFVVAYFILRALAVRRLIDIPHDRIADAMTWLILGVVGGGRLGYILFYDPSLLTSFSSSFPFWGVFALSQGGMASHGGMVGVILACWFISRGFRTESNALVGRTSTLHVMDCMALAATPGLFFGRIANFVNGELLGKIVAMPGQAAPWWTVRFPQELLARPMSEGGHRPDLTPAQSAALDALVRAHALPSDDFRSATGRMLTLLQSGPDATRSRLAAELAPLVSARHPSQLYQAVAEGLVLGLVLLWFWRAPRAPGLVAACFLILYGVLRVLTEFIRLPDEQLAVQTFAGLSRGQWLSLVMVAAGALLARASVVRSRRFSPPLKLGGWGARAS